MTLIVHFTPAPGVPTTGPSIQQRQPPSLSQGKICQDVDISSVMEDVDDDDTTNDHNTEPGTTASSFSFSSSFSSSFSLLSSLSNTTCETNPTPAPSHNNAGTNNFGRMFPYHSAMEDARRVVFHPTQNPPTVHEFDWKVEFTPATTSGCKRDAESAALTTVSSSYNTSQEQMDEEEQDCNMMMVTTDDYHDDTLQTCIQTPQDHRNMTTTMVQHQQQQQQQQQQQTPINNGRSRRRRRLQKRQQHQTTPHNVTNNSCSSSGSGSNNNNNDNSSNSSFFQSIVGSANRFSYSRPAKRTKVEANYHLSPSAEHHGILKNRMTSPDALPAITATTNNHVASPSTFAMSPTDLAQPALQQQQQQQQTATSKKRTKNKHLRFVESRMKVVQRFKVGNLFNFGSSNRQMDHTTMTGGSSGSGSGSGSGDLFWQQTGRTVSVQPSGQQETPTVSNAVPHPNPFAVPSSRHNDATRSSSFPAFLLQQQRHDFSMPSYRSPTMAEF
jgi:hypothetical protein